MSLRSKSRHRKAESAIGAAHDLIDAAHAQLGLAEEHNRAAGDAHHVALTYHSEQLDEVHKRGARILALKAKLP